MNHSAAYRIGKTRKTVAMIKEPPPLSPVNPDDYHRIRRFDPTRNRVAASHDRHPSGEPESTMTVQPFDRLAALLRTTICAASLLAVVAVTGCRPPAGSSSTAPTNAVVVYVALDQEFSQPILDEFSRKTGITVRAKYDVESTKTVGLTQELLASANHPRCDLFWNNEILNTLRLENKGLLDSYSPRAAEPFPAAFRSAQGKWHGFAARARILLVNKKLVPAADRPRSIRDLLDARWRGKVGIAKPLFGTTATHCACLFAVWGDEAAREFFRGLKANDIQVLSGNKQVALAVSRGEIAIGLTDTDDAYAELEKGQPVEMIYPDREADQLGTLFIPNSLSILRGRPHPDAARQLVEYLLSPEVEARLANGPSGQIPLNPQVAVPVKFETPQTVKAMEVDFAEAARQWDAAARFVRDEFAR